MPESFELSSLEALRHTEAPSLHVGRRAWRMAQIGGWTALWSVAWGLGTLGTLPWPSARRRWRTSCFRRWSRGVMTILRVRVTVKGPAPSAGPFILAANHLSYLDVIVLASLVPTVFVAKREVRGWSVWGPLAWAMGTIFIDRTSARDTQRVGGSIERVLERRGGVTLFPEGTSTAGRDVAPFRSSLLDAAVRTDTPVHYVGLSYGTAPNDPPAHLSVCWWGEMEFAPHFSRLCGLERIDMLVYFGDQPLQEADRKTLAVVLHRAVSEHFTPVVTEVS